MLAKKGKIPILKTYQVPRRRRKKSKLILKKPPTLAHRSATSILQKLLLSSSERGKISERGKKENAEIRKCDHLRIHNDKYVQLQIHHTTGIDKQYNVQAG